MIKLRKGRSFQIVAFMPYRFYMDENGVTIRNERGRKIGTFATEKEAVEYMKTIQSNENGGGYGLSGL